MKLFCIALLILSWTACKTNRQEESVKPIDNKINSASSKYTETTKADSKNADSAEFVTIIDFYELQKDGGICINDFIVNIGDERAKRLDGKSVRISGEVKIYDSFEDDKETGNVVENHLSDFSVTECLTSIPDNNGRNYTEFNTAGSKLYGLNDNYYCYHMVKQERIGRIKQIIVPKIETIE